MNFKIRGVSHNDSEKVISLWMECGLVVPWNDPKKDFQRKLNHSPDQFLVAEIGHKIIASLMYAWDGHRGSVNYLAVLPEFHRKRIGEELMGVVENRLAGSGCPKINLLIRKTNLDVIKFYQALGYLEDPVLCMGKRLIPDD